jgi:putative transposase
MIGFVAERLMALEVGRMTGAAHGERSPDRLVPRNGYRQRDRETRAGTVALPIPKLRRGSCFRCFVEPRRTAEKALVAVIQEVYVHGVSTRAVDDLVQAMGASGISKSQVSRLCAELDERVGTFHSRSASIATDGAKCSAWRPAPARRRRSGPISCARWPGAACVA